VKNVDKPKKIRKPLKNEEVAAADSMRKLQCENRWVFNVLVAQSSMRWP
jgi:hypothetical protein